MMMRIEVSREHGHGFVDYICMHIHTYILVLSQAASGGENRSESQQRGEGVEE